MEAKGCKKSKTYTQRDGLCSLTLTGGSLEDQSFKSSKKTPWSFQAGSSSLISDVHFSLGVFIVSEGAPALQSLPLLSLTSFLKIFHCSSSRIPLSLSLGLPPLSTCSFQLFYLLLRSGQLDYREMRPGRAGSDWGCVGVSISSRQSPAGRLFWESCKLGEGHRNYLPCNPGRGKKA